MKQEPRLGEFEAQILHYEQLERQIAAEKEYYNVGPVALYTGESESRRNVTGVSSRNEQ